MGLPWAVRRAVLLGREGGGGAHSSHRRPLRDHRQLRGPLAAQLPAEGGGPARVSRRRVAEPGVRAHHAAVMENVNEASWVGPLTRAWRAARWRRARWIPRPTAGRP
eukprot:3530065-Prymnesium_polylepis.1